MLRESVAAHERCWSPRALCERRKRPRTGPEAAYRPQVAGKMPADVCCGWQTRKHFCSRSRQADGDGDDRAGRNAGDVADAGACEHVAVPDDAHCRRW